MLAATGVLGVLAGVVLSLAFPPRYTATTVVLVRHTNVGVVDPAQAIATDAQLVTSSRTAEHAVARLGGTLSTSDLLAQSRATPVTNDVLRISVTGPTERESVRRADALAEAFLAIRTQVRLEQADAEVRVLTERQQELARELDAVIAEAEQAVGGGPSEGRGELLARRNELANRIAQLGRRAEETRLTARTVAASSRVLDPGRLDERSPTRALFANMAGGLVVGIALGTGVVVAQEVASDRVRRREEVAAALGAPVAVSVGPLRGSPAVQRRRLEEHQATRRADLARVVGHFRGLLATLEDVPAGLVVVSVASDSAAALAVGATAMELVREEGSVALVDLSEHASLAELFGVPADEASTAPHRVAGSRVVLTVPPPELLAEERRTVAAADPDARFVLALATLDPALGAAHLSRHWSTAVVVVTGGRSTPTALRATAQMLRAAGIELHSAVMVAASRQDETVGVTESFVTELPARKPASWAAR